jgi:hypothetical protein
VVHKEVPPDVDAQKYWTMNRMKDLWRSIWKLEGKIVVERIIKELSDISDEELQEFAQNKN